MMKHRYILICALAALLPLLCSCNKAERPTASESDDIITFSPVLDGSETKGTMITGTTYDYTALGAFLVKAWNKNATSAQFGYTKVMPFKHTTGSEHSYWSTVDDSNNIKEYFWKKTGDNVETKYFYAYTNLPAKGATVSSNNWYSQNLQYNVYEIPNASDQKDILLGIGHGTGYTKTDYVGRFIKITFGHPLSAIKFKKGTLDGWVEGTDKITSVSISGVYSSGKYYNNDEGSSWTPSSSTTVNMTNSGGLTIGTGDIIGETFFLIPQSLTAAAITITVSLTIGGSTYSPSATLSAGDWKAGKYYTYTLNYTSGMSPVLSVSLADWGEIKSNADMEDGSVLGYGDPEVDPWDDGTSGNLNYTD